MTPATKKRVEERPCLFCNGKGWDRVAPMEFNKAGDFVKVDWRKMPKMKCPLCRVTPKKVSK